MSRIESVVRLVLEFNKAFNNRDITVMMELLDNNCTIETAGPAPDVAVYSGVEEISQYYMDLVNKSSKCVYEDRRNIWPRRTLYHALEIQLGR